MGERMLILITVGVWDWGDMEAIEVYLGDDSGKTWWYIDCVWCEIQGKIHDCTHFFSLNSQESGGDIH